MIPQNELRIGNWLYFDSPVPGEDLNQTRQMDNFMFMAGEKCFRPIPITEDWLIRLGFKKEHEGEVYINYFNEVRFGVHHRMVCDEYFESGFYCGEHIKQNYIHQLQNLYFALTGKELELKQNEQ